MKTLVISINKMGAFMGMGLVGLLFRLVFCSFSGLLMSLIVLATPAVSATFSQYVGFGDSTLDSGWWRGAESGACAGLATPCNTGNPDKDLRITNAINRGGTGAPVGVGQMHSQFLAQMYGLTAEPVNQPGGTNYAISGSLTRTVVGEGGNLNVNPILPSTIQQIGMYLAGTSNVANQNALYVIGTGGNDLRYALDNPALFPTGNARRAFVDNQISGLVTAVGSLQAAGAHHILIDGVQNNDGLAGYWNEQVRLQLDAAGIQYTYADVAGLLDTITAHPTDYGFTPLTVQPGVAGDDTRSACVSGPGASGWGQFCANRLGPTFGFPHAYLRSSDSEETSLYSDNEHLSNAGQRLLAEYEFSLLSATGAVPEPSTWAMIILGFAGIGAMSYRRNCKDTAALAAA